MYIVVINNMTTTTSDEHTYPDPDTHPDTVLYIIESNANKTPK